MPIALVYAAMSIPAVLRSEVNRMELFTSLVSSLAKREDGQTMASEVVAMALIVFAIWGAFSLLGHLG